MAVVGAAPPLKVNFVFVMTTLARNRVGAGDFRVRKVNGGINEGEADVRLKSWNSKHDPRI